MTEIENAYRSGVDIGSTTAKVVICDEGGTPVFARYRRHQGRTEDTTREIFDEASRELGNIQKWVCTLLNRLPYVAIVHL